MPRIRITELIASLTPRPKRRTGDTGKDIGQITLSLKDEAVAHLRKDYDAFVRVSVSLDPQFATPSFEDFLRAKLLDDMVPLTEQAMQKLLQGGQYAWAKRTLGREFPDLVGILVGQAKEFGFGFAARSEWTTEELAAQCREWVAAIVAEAHGEPSMVEPLAVQIQSAAQDIQTHEEADVRVASCGGSAIFCALSARIALTPLCVWAVTT